MLVSAVLKSTSTSNGTRSLERQILRILWRNPGDTDVITTEGFSEAETQVSEPPQYKSKVGVLVTEGLLQLVLSPLLLPSGILRESGPQPPSPVLATRTSHLICLRNILYLSIIEERVILSGLLPN